MTLNRKSQGQDHNERSQLRRSHQGLFSCKVSSLYWLMWPRKNLNAEVNQNVDGRTDGQTDRRTDRRTSSIHKPELLCHPAKKCKSWNINHTPLTKMSYFSEFLSWTMPKHLKVMDKRSKYRLVWRNFNLSKTKINFWKILIFATHDLMTIFNIRTI